MTGNRIGIAVVAAALTLAGCKKADKQAEPGAASAGSAGAPGANGAAKSGGGASSGGSEPQAVKTPEGCNSDLSQPVEANYTFTAKCSPYTVKGSFAVDGFDLTIEPGVEIRLLADATFDVGWNRSARLTARGTAEKPIRFVSGGRQEPGSWKSIGLHANAGGSVLEYVTVENGGSGPDDPAILINAPDISLSHLTVTGAKGLAVEMRNTQDHKLAKFADNDLSQAGGSEVVARLNALSLGAISNSKFPARSVIEVIGAVNQDVHAPNAGVPYRSHGELEIEGADEGKSAILTVDPGVTWQFGDDGSVSVGWNRLGQLKAVGTAEKPIVFTHTGDQTKGAWKGLLFNSNAKPPQLSWLRVEWAGTKDAAAISYRDGKGLGTLTHAVIAHSAGDGVLAQGDNTQPFEAFSDNAFQDVDGAAVSATAALVARLGTGNDYGEDGRIDVKGGTLEVPAEWSAQPAPYVVRNSLTVDAPDALKPTALTIAAGTTVRFMPEAQLQVSWNNPASVVAKGTAEKKIVFAAMSEPWKGIHVGSKGKAALENVVIEKVSDDEFGLNAEGTASGSAKIEVKDVKKAARHCSGKLKVDLTGGGETEQDC